MIRDRIAGVVLAAGLSSRMGRNKLFIEIGGETILRRAAGAALAANLDPVIVVVGHERERAQAELAGLRCEVVYNERYNDGQGTSLRAGFRALGDELDGAVVLLADMPFVTAGMLRALCDRFREATSPLAISTYGGVQAPPALYGRALFEELRALEGEGAGKEVVKRHRKEALVVQWPESLLADLDVPADVDRARERWEAR